MKTSAAGRAAIIAREGKRLVAYRDSVGVLTIGVGHTGRMAPPKVTPGMRITDAQCDAFLAADLAPVEAALAAALTVPVTQNEWDAMVSWLFNVGKGYAKSSTTIIRQLNLGDVKAAAAGFDLFHKPASIIGRRDSEKAQFLRPDMPDGATPTPVVLEKRAAALHGQAASAKRSGTHDARLSAGGAVMAAGIAAAQPIAQHHHGLLWLAAGMFAVLAVGAAITALLSHRKAATLNANADAHAAAAPRLAHLDASTTNIVDALQQ